MDDITLVVTAACNLHCRYCYRTRSHAGRVEWPSVRAVLDRALQSDARSVRLTFTGGEPLLHFPVVVRAVRHIEQAARPPGSVRYTIATNGSRLGTREATFFEKHGFQVNLSFDGVAPAQAARGRGTFVHLDALLDRLRRNHWPLFDSRLRVVATLTPGTIGYLADSVDYFIAKHVRTFSVSPAMKQRHWKVEDLERLDREFSRVFDRLRRLYDDTGQVPLLQFRKTSNEPGWSTGTDAWLCRAPRAEGVAIDVDGVAYGCLLATSSYAQPAIPALRPALAALRVGRPTEPDFDARLADMPVRARACGAFQHPELRYSSYGRCGDCQYLPRCHVCPFSAAREPAANDVHRVNDFMCAFSQVLFKYRDKFPRQPDPYELLTGRAPVPNLIRELLDQRPPLRAGSP